MISQPKRPVILASKSPRRAALLDQINLAYQVQPATIDESQVPRAQESPITAAEYLAEKKARTIAETARNAFVIGADTVVHLDGQILGKPQNSEEAITTLRQLSGNSHRVITGVALIAVPEQIVHVFSEETVVHFRNLTGDEIKAYVATGEPKDKAGAYGIQGLGALLVDYIHGDYNNVVGFPVSAFYQYFIQIKSQVESSG
ncbi:MAG: Maf family protein [Candidatus Marinimicrobia bacterium]|nr:Maf family protein [Candidatus Neomarinimicrobiota bacterium]MCF7829614.1 Maf family protein [Candidatus Neomarinimicrobiota bacterium]MCF7879774.1 Maf family protein [Candidatus Neomarinimicrobiota bacterium]